MLGNKIEYVRIYENISKTEILFEIEVLQCNIVITRRYKYIPFKVENDMKSSVTLQRGRPK